MNGQPTEFEVLVVGGGLTGIVFALLLQSQVTGARRLPIGIVESGPTPSPAPPAELALRVVALSPASRAVLERCGAWAGLPATRIRSVPAHGRLAPRRRAGGQSLDHVRRRGAGHG